MSRTGWRAALWINAVERDYRALAALMPRSPAGWASWAEFELSIPNPQRAYDLAHYAAEIGDIGYSQTWITLGDAALVMAQIDPTYARDYLHTARDAYLRAWAGDTLRDRFAFVDGLEALRFGEIP